MRVLHVESGRHLYGGALQVLYLLQGLQNKADCQNYLVCPRLSDIQSCSHEYADQIYTLPIKGDLDFTFFLRLLKIIKKVQPDIVHVHSRRGADIWGGLAGRLSGVKTILSRRVDNPESRLVVKAKYRLFDKIIVISRKIGEVLLKEGIAPEKIACVPSAVDFLKYQQTCEYKWFYQEFNLAQDVKPIGVIAQFIPRKGHTYVLDALPAIIQEHPKAHFIFFGKGPLENEMQRLIQEKGLQQHVTFAGFRNDLDQILPCLYMLVHPALMEGLGVCLLQAAAAGLPLVATNVGGIPEIVQHGVNGYLLPAANKIKISQAVNSLLADRVMAAEFGKKGREMVKKNFSIPAMVNGNYKLYLNLLGKKA